uniref:Uncharacterized protein n=1 Tax=Opuntia streptacantha TaxID=393608 RepID=A0A7C9EVW4_OPUST
MSESRSRNCFRISSIICRVICDKKLSQQKDLSVLLCFASFHPSNAFSSAIWSLQESPANNLFAASASSFLLIGRTKGSRYARAAAIVNAGFRHWKIDPIRSIFPMCGSKGKVQRCLPSGVSSSLSSKAPIVFNSSIAFWTDRGSGGWSAFARNDPMPPSCRLFMFRHNSCKGALRISGNWY